RCRGDVRQSSRRGVPPHDLRVCLPVRGFAPTAATAAEPPAALHQLTVGGVTFSRHRLNERMAEASAGFAYGPDRSSPASTRACSSSGLSCESLASACHEPAARWKATAWSALPP